MGQSQAGWRVRNNVALAFFDRFSLRNDPRKTTREFVVPLATVEGSVDHNVVVPAEIQSQLFVDSSVYNFHPRRAGLLAGKGVTIDDLATANPGSPPSIGALEPDTIAWQPGADWMTDNLPISKSPAEAIELAKRFRPAAIPLIKHDRRYEDQ